MEELTPYKGEILIGKSNFYQWKKDVSLHLEVNGLKSYIDGTERRAFLTVQSCFADDSDPDLVSTYLDKKAKYARKTLQTLGAIKATLNPYNNYRFREEHTAHDLWTVLEKTYGEINLDPVAPYFKRIMGANYDYFSGSMEYFEYFHNCAERLADLDCPVPDSYIALAILRGLPEMFDEFSARKNEEIVSGKGCVDLGKLECDLISEENRLGFDDRLEEHLDDMEWDSELEDESMEEQ